jgi:homocitrate synthase NifV
MIRHLTKTPRTGGSFRQHLSIDPLQQPSLLDTTLRDGEQSPGLYFTNNEKVIIARALDELGVGIIEAGIPGMGKEEKNVFRKLVGLNLKAEILAWNRLAMDDVRSSLEAGVRSIHVSVPTSPQQLSRKIGREPSWIFRRMEEVVGFAVSEGLSVSLGAEDASRTETNFLKSIFLHAVQLGVTRVRYADTLGILTPEKTSRTIRALTHSLGIPLDFHAHNDFGLATANALSAWKAGASVISCSLLGLGERAGNTALEEFVGNAHFLEGRFPDFDFPRLRKLCETVSIFCGRPIASQKPLFGSEVFNHESGIHVDGLIKDRLNYELFPPERVGGKSSIIVGKHSGRSALKYLASLQHHTLTDPEAQGFLNALRTRMASQKGVNADGLFEAFLLEKY